MKKLFFAFMLSVMTMMPLFSFAGTADDVLYCAWFDDSANTTGTAFRYNNWIQMSNPNGSEAQMKITYYKPDGSKYVFSNGSTSKIRTIPAKGNATWRPNDDMQLTGSVAINGSYVIDVTKQSLSGIAAQIVKAGDSLPGIGTEYNLGQNLTGYEIPLFSTMSNYLDATGFWVGNDTDNIPTTVGDYNSWIYINNPSDNKTAQVNVYFYKSDGTAFLLNGLNPPKVYTIEPHQTITIYPPDLGITGNPGDGGGGPIIVDVDDGKVVAVRVNNRCNQSKIVKTYDFYAFSLYQIQKSH